MIDWLLLLYLTLSLTSVERFYQQALCGWVELEPGVGGGQLAAALEDDLDLFLLHRSDFCEFFLYYNFRQSGNRLGGCAYTQVFFFCRISYTYLTDTQEKT